MNRTLKIALAAVLGLGLVLPASAQNFPDVPDDHWAYEALANLKGNVLHGYPDGIYRGARPMSRYEFAVAINQLNQMLMGRIGGVESQVSALKARVDAMKPGASQADLDALKAQVASMESAMKGMSAWKSDIDTMKRLQNEFEKELAGLGVDVDAMKKDMSDLEKRVAALEGAEDAVGIHGDLNFLALAGHSADDTFGLSPGGRTFGVSRDGWDLPTGMTRDFSVFHELNLTLDGEVGEGATWKASVNVGNILGGGGYELNGINFGAPFNDSGASDVHIDEANVNFGTSLVGQGFDMTVGRFYHQGGAFFLARPDYTEFYDNDRWDNGSYIIDGGRATFGFGGVDLTVLAGRTSDRNTVNGGDLTPINAGGYAVDQMLGVELNFGLGENGGVKGVYYWQDANVAVGGVNRVNTYGAEVNFSFDAFKVYGVYAATNMTYNTSTVLDDDNTALAAAIQYDGGRWGLGGFYGEIEGNFAAAGSWGRLGTEWNPTNVKGYGAMAWFKASDNLTVNAQAEFFQPKDLAVVGNVGFGGLDYDVTSYAVKLNYTLNEAWGLMLGYENVDWDVAPAGNPQQAWFTLGLNYKLAKDADILLKYMYSDVDFDGMQGFFSGGAFAATDIYKGGMFATQVRVRF